MSTIHTILSALDERTIARRKGIPHDEARMSYPLRNNTVGTFDEFSRLIGDYYNHHFTRCISGGGRLSDSEAAGRAKELLERAQRRTDGTIVTVFNDAHDGTNGGMRVVLDTIAEGLKAESVERYIRDLFDRFVAPNAWEDQVEIIRQFMAQAGSYLSSTVRADQPERYARDHQRLIRSYVEGLQRTSSIFRRL